MTKSILALVLSGVAVLLFVSQLWSKDKPFVKSDKAEYVEVQPIDPVRQARGVWISHPWYTRLWSGEVIALVLGAVSLFVGIVGIVEAKEAQRLAKETKVIAEEARRAAYARANASQPGELAAAGA